VDFLHLIVWTEVVRSRVVRSQMDGEKKLLTHFHMLPEEELSGFMLIKVQASVNTSGQSTCSWCQLHALLFSMHLAAHTPISMQATKSCLLGLVHCCVSK